MSGLSAAGYAFLERRSEKNKVGVPVDRTLVPPEGRAGLEECLSSGFVTWIDRLHHPAAGGREIDVFLVTPAGAVALGKRGDAAGTIEASP